MKSHRNDARYPGSVTIHYPLHPFYGQELPVARRFGSGNALQFELQADDRRVLVPAWMTDVDRCGQLTRDGDLRTSMIALLELACLVRKGKGKGKVECPLFLPPFPSKVFPIQADEHFLTVCRYVERNALRAGVVQHAQDWRWGSLWGRHQGDETLRAVLSVCPLECPTD